MKQIIFYILASVGAVIAAPIYGAGVDGPGKVEPVRCFYFQPEATWGTASLEIEAALGKYSQALYAINGVLFPFPPKVLYKVDHATRVPLGLELRLSLLEGVDQNQIEKWIYANSPEAVSIEVGAGVKVKDIALIGAILHQLHTNIILLNTTSSGTDVVLSADTTGPRIQK
jgi:hypothetical protein